jgi:hypothetical protein
MLWLVNYEGKVIGTLLTRFTVANFSSLFEWFRQSSLTALSSRWGERWGKDERENNKGYKCILWNGQ